MNHDDGRWKVYKDEHNGNPYWAVYRANDFGDPLWVCKTFEEAWEKVDLSIGLPKRTKRFCLNYSLHDPHDWDWQQEWGGLATTPYRCPGIYMVTLHSKSGDEEKRYAPYAHHK